MTRAPDKVYRYMHTVRVFGKSNRRSFDPFCFRLAVWPPAESASISQGVQFCSLSLSPISSLLYSLVNMKKVAFVFHLTRVAPYLFKLLTDFEENVCRKPFKVYVYVLSKKVIRYVRTTGRHRRTTKRQQKDIRKATFFFRSFRTE